MIGKALYVAMRGNVLPFNEIEYLKKHTESEALENEDCDYERGPDAKEYYKERWFDICAQDQNYLCDVAGIHVNSFQPAFESLVNNFLAEYSAYGGYLVFLRPPKYATPAPINKQVHADLSRYYGRY